MKFLIINGPNMNLLGIREPKIYGTRSFAELESYITSACDEAKVEPELFFSNSEGEIVDKIQAAYGAPVSSAPRADGIVINAAGYTHTSVAIRDAIAAVGIACAEVHLTDTDNRTGEDFRKLSLLSPVCVFTVKGKGFAGYREAIFRLKSFIEGTSKTIFI